MYASDKFHRLIQETNTGINYAYSHDDNGNLLTGPDFTDPTQTGTRTIFYNGDNMPKSIDHTLGGTTTVVNFAYDQDNKRAKKSITGGTTTYYVDKHFQVKDTGNVENTTYLLYGHERSSTGKDESGYKFTDQEKDKETKLYNYDARLYDPVTGQFITTDTLILDVYNPQSLNRYAYCLNNPVKYVDPTGHSEGLSNTESATGFSSSDYGSGGDGYGGKGWGGGNITGSGINSSYDAGPPDGTDTGNPIGKKQRVDYKKITNIFGYTFNQYKTVYSNRTTYSYGPEADYSDSSSYIASYWGPGVRLPSYYFNEWATIFSIAGIQPSYQVVTFNLENLKDCYCTEISPAVSVTVDLLSTASLLAEVLSAGIATPGYVTAQFGLQSVAITNGTVTAIVCGPKLSTATTLLGSQLKGWPGIVNNLFDIALTKLEN